MFIIVNYFHRQFNLQADYKLKIINSVVCICAEIIHIYVYVYLNLLYL